MASAYNHWWWFVDAQTGKALGKIDTPDVPNAHNLTVTADGKMAALASLTPVSAALAPKTSAARLYGKPNVAIADLDGTSGKVLRQVQVMGAERDTVVVFLSDNGASSEQMIRGDGHLRSHSYPRGNVHRFRLALTDAGALTRTRHFLGTFGVKM